MSLSEAFAAALAALSAPGNGEYTAAQLEVAILDRARDHRTFRRIRGARLEQLLAESRPAPAAEDSGDAGTSGSGADSGSDAAPGSPGSGPAASSGGSPGSGSASPSAGPTGTTGPADSDPPTGPAPGGSDRGSGLGGGSPL
jgi:proteasome alpha subunit